MVDVAEKAVTQRICVARGAVRMAAETLARIADGSIPKGDVLAVARLAGIQAAKRTGELIPLCHPISLDHVEVDLHLLDDTVHIQTLARATGRTGVEMEALTAAGGAALAVYDMVKAASKAVEIGPIRLLEKSGGKSGHWKRDAEES